MLGAKRWAIRQKANFNPIRGVGTGPSVQKAQSTGVVKALAVSSQHLILSLHTGLTDFQLQHQQCSVWGRTLCDHQSQLCPHKVNQKDQVPQLPHLAGRITLRRMLSAGSQSSLVGMSCRWLEATSLVLYFVPAAFPSLTHSFTLHIRCVLKLPFK